MKGKLMTRIALIWMACLGAVSLAGEEEAELQARVEKLVAQVRVAAADFDFSTQRGQDAFKMADVRASEASGSLLMMFQQYPKAWRWARPGLRDLPREAKRRDLKLRLIELLSHDADKETLELLAAELKADARGIRVRAIIRMDRNDVVGAAKALDTIVAEKPGYRNLEAAIHLGFKGKKNAKPVLDWALSSGAGKRDFMGLTYGTAIAYKRLGNAKPWQELSRRARDEVDKYLKADDFKTARWYALQFEYYSGLAKSKGAIDVLALDGAAARHVRTRSRQIETIKDLHELLQSCAKA